jgi:hypothetical protein
MPNIDNARHTPKGVPVRVRSGRSATAVLAILALTCLVLTACGGSSGGSSSAGSSKAAASTNASTSTSGASSNAKAAGSGGPKVSSVRRCLEKNGVALPKAGGSGALGGPHLPKGMTRAQFEAKLRQCGGSGFGRGFAGPRGAGTVNNPVFKQALGKFATCLRQKGVKIPAPNTSGNGPIFSTKGVNTTSPQFRAATKACRGVLIGAFRSLRPGNGVARPGTAPPATTTPTTTTPPVRTAPPTGAAPTTGQAKG